MKKIIAFIIWILVITGEIKCIYKMCMCNWNPIGKAEVFYTLGTFTATGCVIGWIDIKDEK